MIKKSNLSRYLDIEWFPIFSIATYIQLVKIGVKRLKLKIYHKTFVKRTRNYNTSFEHYVSKGNLKICEMQ